MAESDRLRLADLRAAFRLIGECRERANRDAPFHQRYYRRIKGGVHTRRLESVVDDAENRVADRLAISRHVVNRHVQRLYRRFGVHSRGKLMFRCRDILPSLRVRTP